MTEPTSGTGVPPPSLESIVVKVPDLRPNKIALAFSGEVGSLLPVRLRCPVR